MITISKIHSWKNHQLISMHPKIQQPMLIIPVIIIIIVIYSIQLPANTITQITLTPTKQ